MERATPKRSDTTILEQSFINSKCRSSDISFAMAKDMGMI